MQDRYVADVGDYAKYGLLRRLSEGLKLGVAWYLHPDEPHNKDGRHDFYLRDSALWSHLDPDLFQVLETIRSQGGGVAAVEASGVLGSAVFAAKRLDCEDTVKRRRAWRLHWFEDVMHTLADCDIVFADPDNGLYPDKRFRHGSYKDWKRLPLSEALDLSVGRCAILYHHNTRRKGGHVAEIAHWLSLLPRGTLAIRARAGTSRTFFIVNPSPEIEKRAREFVTDWASAKVELHEVKAE